MLDLLNQINRRADYLDRALPQPPPTQTSDINEIAQTVLEALCIEFSKELEAGKLTREHLKMVVEEDTGVAAVLPYLVRVIYNIETDHPK